MCCSAARYDLPIYLKVIYAYFIASSKDKKWHSTQELFTSTLCGTGCLQ